MASLDSIRPFGINQRYKYSFTTPYGIDGYGWFRVVRNDDKTINEITDEIDHSLRNNAASAAWCDYNEVTMEYERA